MKLFTIGDSISQGFMSLAAAKPTAAYPNLLSAALGIPTAERPTPAWPRYGLPADLEAIYRTLEKFGGNVAGPIEWARALGGINRLLDDSEDYYERGEGASHRPDPSGREWWHNVAYYGADVADAWLLTPRICRREIDLAKSGRKDNWPFGAAAAPFYRSALRTLNPSGKPEFEDFAAIDWLRYHAEREGVENTVLWLGSNNALGTVLRLEIRQTPNDPGYRPHTLGHVERASRCWNLWHPDDFEDEYAALIEKTDEALSGNKFKDDRVFVGTVPYVTIAPLAKGVGDVLHAPGFGYYFKYYIYFPFEERDVPKGTPHLTVAEAMLIDRSIQSYNETIRRLVQEANGRLGRERYHVVDLNDVLSRLAWKRNGGLPTYELPRPIRFRHPQVNTKYYHATRDGQLKQGGIFSLDGVHPTSIGHGLIAHEFLKVFQQAGVQRVDGQTVDPERHLDWEAIVSSDTLYQQPIRQTGEVYQNKDLLAFVLRLLGAWGRGCREPEQPRPLPQ